MTVVWWLLAALFVLLWAYLPLFLIHQWRLWSLRTSRSGYCLDDFLNEFKGEVDVGVARKIYGFLQGQVFSKDFPVHPEDHLVKVYGLDEEDGIEFLNSFIEESDVPPFSLREFTQIETVGDLVRVLGSRKGGEVEDAPVEPK